MIEKSFQEVADSIKSAITNTQLEIMNDANKKLVNLYYNIVNKIKISFET